MPLPPPAPPRPPSGRSTRARDLLVCAASPPCNPPAGATEMLSSQRAVAKEESGGVVACTILQSRNGNRHWSVDENCLYSAALFIWSDPSWRVRGCGPTGCPVPAYRVGRLDFDELPNVATGRVNRACTTERRGRRRVKHGVRLRENSRRTNPLGESHVVVHPQANVVVHHFGRNSPRRGGGK